MTIAYLSNSMIPSREANAVHVMKMCAAFSALGREVTLYARTPDEPAADDHAYYGVKPGFEIVKRKWPGIRGLGGIIYGLGVQWAVVNGPKPAILYGRDVYSMFMLRGHGAPLYYESHQAPGNSLRLYLEGRILHSLYFKRLIVISEPLREQYLKAFPRLSPDRVLVAPDAADDPGEGPHEQVPLPGRPDALKVGYVGALYPGRGIELILDLARQVPEADFHVIGGSKAEVGAYESGESPANAHFHGFVPPGRLTGYFAGMDAFIAPYQARVAVAGGRGDTSAWMSPLKIFEYMSWGRPIAASKLPAIERVLNHGETALLCPPDDVGAWAEAVKNLVRDPGLREKLGGAARREFLARYTWAGRARAVLSHEVPGD